MSFLNIRKRKVLDRERKQGYYKAIDDFAEAVKSEYAPVSGDMPKEYIALCSRIDKIASRLKGKEGIL
ncbi:MAG: hypothetical protein ACI4FX_10885 [Agathobacter sp.]